MTALIESAQAVRTVLESVGSDRRIRTVPSANRIAPTPLVTDACPTNRRPFARPIAKIPAARMPATSLHVCGSRSEESVVSMP
jgi:biotin synthase-related radical SAM superfamily protein